MLRNSESTLIDKYEYKVVVYDTNTENTNQLDKKKSFAFILLDKLVKRFKSISFLIGGFENFIKSNLNLCESTCISQSTLSLNKMIVEYNHTKLEMNSSLNASNETEFESLIQESLDLDNKKKELSKSTNEPAIFDEKEIRSPTKILNFLYLGSQEDALSESTMKVNKNHFK